MILILAVVIVYNKTYFYSDSSHSAIQDLKFEIAKLDSKYKNLDLRASNVATTINKKTILLCIEDPETNRPYSQNTLMGVLLHELAHYESQSYGEHSDDHNDEWHMKYEDLVEKAIDLDIYNPKYPPPKNYCKIV